MQRISDVTQQTQERTTQARTFIKALNQSCEPWQRLAALDPVPGDAASGPWRASAIARMSQSLAARLLTPLRSRGLARFLLAVGPLSRRATRVRHDAGREGVGSERAR